MSSIDEIKSRIDIVDLVSETVKLRRAGKNFSGLCPFHNEKTPSFIVSPDRGTWRCFGQCNEGGDIFSFVMKKEGWDFKEALRHLAQKAGVALESYTPEQQEEKDANDRLRSLLEEAVNFYRHQLLNTPKGQEALTYLHEKRGLTDATIETFGLGYAPDSWDAALGYFTEKGYSDQELLDVGLLSSRESGGYYDRFRNRVMIPIRDERGRMAGFGARILDPNDVPKFLNSPETPLFSKSRLLYGLDRARKPIRVADQAVIVEGYLDVIALHQASFENVVSPMGTALTEDQLRLLKRFTPSNRMILALDPDAAGQAAVLHGLDAARQALDRETESGFDARGLLRHEARLQADLRVVSMPDGLDPDELVQRDPEEWKQLVENAKPIIEHVMTVLAHNRDLRDPKVVSEIGDKVWPLIQDLPRAEEREFFTQRLARFLQVDERAFIYRQAGSPRTGRVRPRVERPVQEQGVAEATQKPAVSPSQKIEAHALSILLARPALLYRLDRILQEAGLSRVGGEDFGYTDHQVIFRLVRQALEQEQVSPEVYLQSELPRALSGMADDWFSTAAAWDLRDDVLLEDLVRAVKTIRLALYTEGLNQVRFILEEAKQKGDLRAEFYEKQAYDYTILRNRLDRAILKLGKRFQG